MPLFKDLRIRLPREDYARPMKAGDKYPVVQPDPDTNKWFKANPNVSGMAMGAGLNDTSPNDPRTVMVNPYSGLSEEGKKGLILNERLRHYMAESDYEPEFEPTPAQIKFFEGEEYGKPENRKYLKQTLVARILTGDESAGDVTPEQVSAAEKLMKNFQSVGKPMFPASIREIRRSPLLKRP